MFQEMFGEGGFHLEEWRNGRNGRNGGMGGRQQNKNNPDKKINVSLEDLYKGKTMKFNITIQY